MGRKFVNKGTPQNPRTFNRHEQWWFHISWPQIFLLKRLYLINRSEPSIQYKPNLTKFKPLFSLSLRRSDNFQLLIEFSANYTDQSILTLMRLKVFRNLWPFDLPEMTQKHNNKTTFVIFKNTALSLKYAIKIWKYKVHTKITRKLLVMGSSQILYAKIDSNLYLTIWHSYHI